MNLLSKIEQKIFNGMISSCDDMMLFLEDESEIAAPEYLLTVNVAKSLATLNQYIGHPYKIYLERKTKLIASECVPSTGRVEANNFLGFLPIFRKWLNTDRNGRADICLYNNERKPVCVIELKGFNSNSKQTLLDLKRNANYFTLVCKTGSSQLQHTCFAAMHSYPNSFTEEDIRGDLDNLTERYHDLQKKVHLPPHVGFQIKIDTIKEGRIIQYDNQDPPKAIGMESNHHFAGVIISYSNQNE
jgi:hypothetical protein